MAAFEHPVHAGISTARDRDPPTQHPSLPFVSRAPLEHPPSSSSSSSSSSPSRSGSRCSGRFRTFVRQTSLVLFSLPPPLAIVSPCVPLASRSRLAGMKLTSRRSLSSRRDQDVAAMGRNVPSSTQRSRFNRKANRGHVSPFVSRVYPKTPFLSLASIVIFRCVGAAPVVVRSTLLASRIANRGSAEVSRAHTGSLTETPTLHRLSIIILARVTDLRRVMSKFSHASYKGKKVSFSSRRHHVGSEF